MSGTRKPTVLLSLVKDKAATARFVSLEALSTEQREQALRLQRLIASGSVLVGVVLGSAAWDVRPVLLQRGVMTITRLFSTDLIGSVQLSDAFKSYVFHVERLAPGLQSFHCGSGDGLSWVTRRYFNQLLSDPGVQIPLNEKIALIGKLLGDIEQLHNASLVHGHIHPSNIAYEEGRLILIDHGFQIHDPGSSHPPTLAPELRGGVASQLNATVASDIYGLGLVAKRLFGSELGLEFGNLIEVLLLSDPKLRPKLNQIASHFVSTGVSDSSPTRETNYEKVAHVKDPSPQIVPPAPTSPAVKRALSFYLPAALSVALGCYLISFPLRSIFHKQSDAELQDKFEKFWDSGQVPLMQQVVSAALHDDADAQALLFEKVQSGSSHPAVQSKLFSIALNPLWEDALTDTDRGALITLGMPSLVPPDKRTLPELAQLSPGVLMAIVGNMAIDGNFESLSKVPIERLGSLPSPYGFAFASLQKLGVKTLKDPVAQALCHILTEDSAPSIVLQFLNDADPAVSIARLQVLTPLFDIFSGLDKKVFDAVSTDPRGGIFSWYSKDIVAGWGGVAPKDKLLLFAGQFPPKLTQEQYLDLLRFPRNNIREKALEALKGLLPPDYSGLLQYFSSTESDLTRTQTISLVSALGVDSVKTHSFVLQWFDTNPSPNSVARVLIETGTNPKLQAFHIEAARYLVDKEWSVSLPDLARMAGSVEPLARTLAYAKLHVDIPEEREVIRKLAEIEPVSRIKEQLLQRLDMQ